MKDAVSIFISILLFTFPLICIAKSAEPVFSIETSQGHVAYSRGYLQHMKHARQVTISNNRAYPGKTMTYTAVRMCDLLAPFVTDRQEMLEFVATDNFVVLIPVAKIMSCGKSDAIAYLAIEPKEKWPLLEEKYGKNVTAGPFELIWTNPKNLPLSDEYWAWSVVAVKSHKKLDEKVFQIAPTVADTVMQARLNRGYEAYISHCAGCHTMNNIGKGHIGVDLNIPKSPVEYYPDDAVLRKFIRDPQSVRPLKNARMSGSDELSLSNEDLDDLIFYFHYMARHKTATQ